MIKWKTNSDNDTIGYLGKWKAFKISWNIMRSQNDPDSTQYILLTSLPGFKRELGKFEKVIKAQEFADKAFKRWLEGSGLKESEDE